MNRATHAVSGRAATRFQIPIQFEGWPGIANGGYLTGLLYRELGGTVEVTLRRPTPVEVPLWLRYEDDQVELGDSGGVLVSATRADASLEPPAPVDFDRAVAARAHYQGFAGIPFPTCFVCGTERSPAEALRIFAGPVEPGRVAAPWVPAPAFEADARTAAVEYVVAALDCPGAWAIASVSERLYTPMLLGRATIQYVAPVAIGLPHVVVGEFKGEAGKKRFSSTAVFDANGRLCAVAESIWFPAPQRS